MKILKADTYLKPIPKGNWELKDDGTRFIITPIKGSTGRPNVTKFLFRPRSYVFGVYSGEDSWFTVKFDKTGLPLRFDLPGELILNPRVYKVFAGYNDGFLGGTFAPGYYSLKERVQYWYCLAQTRSDHPIEDYFLVGADTSTSHSTIVLDLSTALASPDSTVWKKYRIGDPIRIGQGIRIGESYDE